MTKTAEGKVPDILIVGAPRAGTTTVASLLSSHPSIFMSPVKEPHYFAIPDMQLERFRPKLKQRLKNIDIESYLSKDNRKPLHRYYFSNWNEYQRLYRDAPEDSLLAEASPSYLWSKGAAVRINEKNPAAKIIIMLRNPVDRAVSQYFVERKMGMTSRELIEDLRQDLKAENPNWGVSPLYVELGMYSEQVKRYMEVFNRKQIFIGWFDDLIKPGSDFTKELFHFLELPLINTTISVVQKNKSVLPRSAWLNELRYVPAVKKFSQKLGNSSLKSKVKSVFFKSAEKTYPSEIKKILLPIFEPDIHRLEVLLKKDLSAWMN
ncbi:MAG: sulfotransferase [Bacteroidia bacterium]|nr:sulfotransferase [Bacteroidia bacterium]MCZ2277231.1 sulfotransferase [Bacteroidia bacterium]